MTAVESGTVTVAVDGDIAVVTVDNPPVNAISQAVRQGLKDALARIESDDGVRGAVLAGVGKAFIAGADVREFDRPAMEPHLPDVIAAIERCAKPFVACIHGVALGGGLEMALGCHYRVAGPDARLGLPEVTLGIIPGAGGTQRLPRLVGLEAAVDLVTSGRHVDAGEALRIGLVDALGPPDLLPFAVAFARERLAVAPPRLAERTPPVPAEGFFESAATRVARKARGQHSPLCALEALRVSLEMPLAQGLAEERRIFLELRGSEQAKALRHVFFAERAVKKVPGIEGVVPRPVDTVGVVGGGTMGAGIAVAALRAGLPVTLVERDGGALARARAAVARNLEGYVTRGRMSEVARDGLLARFTATEDQDALCTADLIIEAVFEDMALKREVFARLDALAKPGAVLATNTSYLDVDAIAAVTGRPGDVLGLHFFSPAHVMRLLEVVKGRATSPGTLATGFAFGARLGKLAVLAGVCDGFIGNRILAQVRRQYDAMLEDGAMPWEVDAAMEGFGMAMGPYRVMDLAGLDIGWATRKRQAPARDPRDRYVAIADRLCEQGRFGQKSGRGWYRYEDGKPVPDPEVEAIVLAESQARCIERRVFSAHEIQRRALYAMINEGARVVADGIALRPLDVDLVEIHGYGFPRWRGGPMCQADLLGLPEVVAAIRDLACEDERFWRPAPLLEKLVAEGARFEALDRMA